MLRFLCLFFKLSIKSRVSLFSYRHTGTSIWSRNYYLVYLHVPGIGIYFLAVSLLPRVGKEMLCYTFSCACVFVSVCVCVFPHKTLTLVCNSCTFVTQIGPLNVDLFW